MTSPIVTDSPPSSDRERGSTDAFVRQMLGVPRATRLPPGVTLGGRFRLLRELGAGGFGVVYEAEDLRLKRHVAVKVMQPTPRSRARASDDARYRRAFLREARATAMLPHPNIVVIHDVRVVRSVDGGDSATARVFGGTPYLITELLRGVSLRDALRAGPVDVTRAIEIGVQMARALVYAHQAGIIHRDLKPENVFVCADQSIKILDFGLAQWISRARKTTGAIARQAGSAGYMSPEQLRGEAQDVRTDVWSLGVVLFEVLAGTLPFGRSPDAVLSTHAAPPLRVALREVPLALDECVAKCLSKDRSKRYTDASELLRDLERVRRSLSSAADSCITNSNVALGSSCDFGTWLCPYPGLNAFNEQDAKYFFGRSAEVREVIERLRIESARCRWLQIEGASGVGKSSFALAGILPAIRLGWLPDVASGWTIAVLRPGRDPLRSLADALSRSIESPSCSPHGMYERLRAAGGLDAIAREAGGLVLVVDQLEEAFDVPEELRFAFDAVLDAAISASGRPRFFLVSTVRSDLVADIDRFPRLARRLNIDASRYNLQSMSATGLRASVLGPAALAGIDWEDGLSERLLADAGLSAAGVLPLLGHLLRAMWEHSESRSFTHHAYDALGGIGGALAKDADGLLDSLGPTAKERARRLLLALVTSGRGSADTRRVVTRAEAIAEAGGDAEAERILLVLSGAKIGSDPTGPTPRLLVVADSDHETARVDLAHEALLRDWPTLRRWIDEARKSLERRADLESAAQAWIAAGEPPEGLPRGAQLAYYGSPSESMTRAAQTFLRAAIALATREAGERLRTQRRRAIGFATVFLSITGVAVWALFERSLAEGRLRQAVEVADEIVFVIDRKLAITPGTSDARRELLSASSALLERLEATAPGDVDMLTSAIASHKQRGELAFSHDDLTTARRELEIGISVAERLRLREPNRPDVRRLTAECHEALGNVTMNAGDLDTSRASFARAVDLWRESVAASPADTTLRNALARANGQLGDVLVAGGDLTSARLAYESVRDEAQALVESSPENPKFNATLATAFTHIGDVDIAHGDADAGQRAFARALEIRTAIVARDPSNTRVQRGVSIVRNRLGGLTLKQGRVDEARSHYETSLAILQSLCDADPKNKEYVRDKSAALEGLGDVALTRHEWAKARGYYEEEHAIDRALAADDPESTLNKQLLAWGLFKLAVLAAETGKVDEAAAIHEQVLDIRKSLVDSNPKQVAWRQELASSHVALALLKRQPERSARSHRSAAEVLLAGLTRDPAANVPVLGDLRARLNREERH